MKTSPRRPMLLLPFTVVAFGSAFLVSTDFAAAAEPRVLRDVAYAEPKNERQTLDVYAPAEGKGRPIVFWIHGGGWTKGDKTSARQKPAAFNEQGYVFVATNYRFVPNVTLQEMTGDIARAIRWTHEHAAEFGGNPNAIVVMGHSAGAHLAALVCTDERYLKAEGLSLAVIKACVPIDVSMYDIPQRLKDGGSVPATQIIQLFGDTEAAQRALSPAAHVERGKKIPAFLILHVAERDDTKAQAQRLAAKLQAAETSAQVLAVEGKSHGAIGSELGVVDDRPTQALWDFLKGVLKR